MEPHPERHIGNHHLSNCSSCSKQESLHPEARTPHQTSLTNPGREQQPCSVPHYGVCSSHFSAEGDAHAAGVSVGIQPLAGNNHSLPQPLSMKCKRRPFKAEGIALQCHWVSCQYFLRSTGFLFVAHFSPSQVQCSSHASTCLL